MIYDASPLLWPEPSASWDSGVLSPASPPPLSRPLIHTAFPVITLCLAIHFLLLILPGLPGSKTNSIPCPGLVLPLLSSCFNCADFHPPMWQIEQLHLTCPRAGPLDLQGCCCRVLSLEAFCKARPITPRPLQINSLSLSLSPELTPQLAFL